MSNGGRGFDGPSRGGHFPLADVLFLPPSLVQQFLFDLPDLAAAFSSPDTLDLLLLFDLLPGLN